MQSYSCNYGAVIKERVGHVFQTPSYESEKKKILQARRRSDTFLEAWDQVVYYFFKIIWVAKVARFLSLCLFNVKTNKPQNIPTCSNISFVIRRFEHQFKQLSKQIALKSLQPIEFCSHHPKNSKKWPRKKKLDTFRAEQQKQKACLTRVVDSLTLDFPCHTCALFHITEVNSSPRLSDVIIAQVYGFVALLWKSRHNTWKASGLKWESRLKSSMERTEQISDGWAAATDPFFCVFPSSFTALLSAEKWNLFTGNS